MSNNFFTEGFEVVIGNYDDIFDDNGELRPEYLDSAAAVFSELGVARDEIRYERADIGVGVSAEAILLVLTSLTTLFLSGKKINENIDAWKQLGSKLNHVLKRLTNRGEKNAAIYISQPFAAALALGFILEQSQGLKSITLENTITEIVPNPSIDSSVQHSFRHNQMRYYLFFFRTLDQYESVHVICIHSAGRIEFHQVLPVGSWMKFDGI